MVSNQEILQYLYESEDEGDEVANPYVPPFEVDQNTENNSFHPSSASLEINNAVEGSNSKRVGNMEEEKIVINLPTVSEKMNGEAEIWKGVNFVEEGNEVKVEKEGEEKVVSNKSIMDNRAIIPANPQMDNNINFSENLQNHRGNSNDENLIEILPKVFKLPQIFKLDISSIGNKKWRKEGEKLSEYFNYGFNEEIWKEYSHFILDNQESFKDIFENKLENRNNLHHNLLDFSLPMDLGGFGYTYNGDKYSRVNFFLKNNNIPILHPKDNDFYLRIERTAAPYSQLIPSFIPPQPPSPDRRVSQTMPESEQVMGSGRMSGLEPFRMEADYDSYAYPPPREIQLERMAPPPSYPMRGPTRPPMKMDMSRGPKYRENYYPPGPRESEYGYHRERDREGEMREYQRERESERNRGRGRGRHGEMEYPPMYEPPYYYSPYQYYPPYDAPPSHHHQKTHHSHDRRKGSSSRSRNESKSRSRSGSFSRSHNKSGDKHKSKHHHKKDKKKSKGKKDKSEKYEERSSRYKKQHKEDKEDLREERERRKSKKERTTTTKALKESRKSTKSERRKHQHH